MAALIALVKDRAPGAIGRVVGVFVTFTGDGSYPAGGYPVTPAVFGFRRQIVAVSDLNTPVTAGGTGKVCEFDAVNSKVKLLQTGGAVGAPFAEVAAGSNQSAVTRKLLVLGG